MDRITKNLVESFQKEQTLPDDIEESTLFEHFVNYCVVSNEFADEFVLDDVAVAGGNDLGIDGLAIVVNGNLITTVEEVVDLATSNKYVDAEFIFTQAKRASSFDGGEISELFYGVKDFFAEKPKLARNEKIAAKVRLQEAIYKQSTLFKRGNPVCKMYYVTTGKWRDDPHLLAKIASGKEDLEALQIFSRIEFTPVDAEQLQKLFNAAKNKVSREIIFEKRTVLPEMNGVREAYIGVLPIAEYFKLIMDESDGIVRGLFYDNVRDFQGDNEVNGEIEETIVKGNHGLFVLLNNGVTIVAENLVTTGNRFRLEDYQIVNGCQTSHVLYKNRDKILPTSAIHIPVKIIISKDDSITNRVIKATNRQTSVRNEELQALTDFQKKLEEYYKAFPPEKRLYYERRSKQYNAMPGIEKVRIITIPSQIRTFSSMFLEQPHTASRYHAATLSAVKGKIFSEDHDPIGYYVSAFAGYRLEALFRSKQIESKYRPFRHHMLAGLRLHVAGKTMPALTANKFVSYCEKIQNVLWDSPQCLAAFKSVATAVDLAVKGDYNRDAARSASLLAQIRDAL